MQRRKINENKTFFFEKINKINKPLARVIRTTRKEAQITNIRNERANVTDDEHVIRKYYEQLYANNFDDLDEMDKFLQTHKISKHCQEKTDKLNTSVSFLKN